MEIWPSSGVVDFRAPSHLNLPETQYPLSVRETHGLAGSSGAHCERSCTLLPRVREREMHNSQFARRRARYYFPRIRYMGCSATGLLVEMALLTYPVCAEWCVSGESLREALMRFPLDHDLLSGCRPLLIWNRRETDNNIDSTIIAEIGTERLENDSFHCATPCIALRYGRLYLRKWVML